MARPPVTATRLMEGERERLFQDIETCSEIIVQHISLDLRSIFMGVVGGYLVLLRCSGAHGLGPGGVGRAVISGDLVQSRDFHYSVEPAAPVYRRPREVAYHPQAQV